MIFGLDYQTWLGLTVIGAMVSTIGAMLGLVLKEYFFTRSFEKWKSRQTLDQIYQKYRDPLLLATRELASRTLEILERYPAVYLRETVWISRPKKQVGNSFDDAYFQRYKLIRTAYRLSAFFAWLELYRQEITYLHPRGDRHARALEAAIGLIKCDLADGQINTASDWHRWRDTLIFREEIRAIGESLIEREGNTRIVIGYGRYSERLESQSTNPVNRWAEVVLNFYLDLEAGGKDFRQVRLQRMFVHLVELLKLLDRSPLEPRLQEACGRLQMLIVAE